MKRWLKEIIWVLFILLILFGGMISSTALPVAVIISFLIIVWRLVLYKKRKKRKEFEIPQELLDDFQYAERRYEETDGQIEPYEILWERAKSKSPGLSRITQKEQGNGVQSIPAKPQYRTELQSKHDSGASVDKTSDNRIKRNNPKRKLFRRR